MVELLGLEEELVRDKLENEETRDSQYQIMKVNVPITEKKKFEDYLEITEEEEKTLTKEEKAEIQNVKGVWFEENYLRTYPMGATASHLVGFTYTGDTADWGIEGYYSSTLNGVNGRQYGYFNEDADVEQTIIEPVDGNSIISTIDVTIQQIVEKYIKELTDGLANGPNGEAGAKNVGVVVADPNTGQILAMATDQPFDLNDPRNLEPFYSEEEIQGMDEEAMLEALNGIWKNFCISDAFEPGSTVKPMTVAAALQDHSILPSATFVCDGYQMFGDTRIRCSIFPGAHGEQTLAQAMANSCNDAMMQIADQMGAEEFLKYQKIFNFGSATGIDLPGEASGIIHTADRLGTKSTELASASFGQGYTCTMIQEVAALCSVINGGNYYRPYVVSKILDENGNVKENVEPMLMKQTVSSEVSSRIREYMVAVMEEGATGNAAKVSGYSMGGKTGTAQKLSEADKTKKYLVSFAGFAPLDSPQVVVYVVVDEPNVDYQADSKYAQYIYKGVMTEILPYLNIFPDEAVEEKENAGMAYLENYIAEKAEENRKLAAEKENPPSEGEDAKEEDGDVTEAEGDQGENSPEEDRLQGEETIKEGADDPNLPAPPEDTTETDLHNKIEDNGITNQEAGFEDGN